MLKWKKGVTLQFYIQQKYPLKNEDKINTFLDKSSEEFSLGDAQQEMLIAILQAERKMLSDRNVNLHEELRPLVI